MYIFFVITLFIFCLIFSLPLLFIVMMFCLCKVCLVLSYSYVVK